MFFLFCRLNDIWSFHHHLKMNGIPALIVFDLGKFNAKSVVHLAKDDE